MSFFNFQRQKVVSDSELLARQLEAVQVVSHELINQTDLDKTLSVIVNELGKKLGYLNPVIYLLDEEKKYISVRKVNVPELIVNLTNRFVGKSVYDVKFYLTDDNLLVNSVKEGILKISSQFFDIYKPFLNKNAANIIQTILGLRSIAIIPISVDNNSIGCLSIGSKNKQFDESEIQVLKTFADQISIAIYNAKLFSGSQQQLNRLESQNKELSHLNYVANHVSSTLNIQEVCQRAVDIIPDHLGFRGAILSLIDEKKRQLIVVAITKSPLTEAAVKLLSQNINEYTTSLDDPKYAHILDIKAINTGQFFTSNNFRDLFCPPLPEIAADGIQKIMGAKSLAVGPIKRTGKIIGTLAFALKDTLAEEITQETLSFMNTYALIVGNAIANSQSFAEKEQTLQALNAAGKELETKNELLEKRAKALEEAAMRERDMMDIVGHELRTPAAVVKSALGFIQMLQRMGKLTDDKMNTYVKRAADSIQREISLINTFLGAAKIEGDQMQFDPSSFSIMELIKNSVRDQQEPAQNKGLQITYRPNDTLPNINGDPIRIREVLDNLISNAIKYSDKGTIEIWSEANADKTEVTTYVKDEGYGISAEDKGKIFKKFGRLKNYSSFSDRASRIVRPGGTGLGLYVTKGIIDMHNGIIDLESEVGKGSTFKFTLPVDCKIDKKHMLNPIFRRQGSKDVFTRLNLTKTKADEPPPLTE